jgi:hypothetical protein
MSNKNTLEGRYRLYAVVAAIFSVICSMVELAFSAYVYNAIPNHNVIRTIEGLQSIGIKEYLFALPMIHLMLSLALSTHAVFWKRALIHAVASDERNRKMHPAIRATDPMGFVRIGAIGMCAASLIILTMSVYRSIWLMVNNV